MKPSKVPFCRILNLAAAALIVTSGIISAQVPLPSGEHLKTLAAKHHLLIGGSTDLNHNDSNEETVIKNEFSVLSNEDCLKPHSLHPEKDKYNFTRADRFVAFCRDNHIVAKAHKLIARDGYLPKWMLDPKNTADDLRRILVSHIENVMGRYKKGSPFGEIAYWDVMNEVLNYSSVFEKLGKNSDGDYLYWELAFNTARRVDPACVLIWNEDNTEFDVPKAERFYETVKRMKAHGVPIDGVGFQCHIALSGSPVPDYTWLAQIFQKFADLGVVIMITEMDVPERPDQVEIYRNIMQVCLNQPKFILWDTWNIIDKYSWRIRNKEKAPLLFDNHYAAKPTYYAIQSVLASKSDDINGPVKTGKQTWAAVNLDAGTFRNGDAIPEASTDADWKKACDEGKPAWCWYDNDQLCGKKYGRLYNWFAVNDPRGLAPKGWHIPIQEEWTTLTDSLGKEAGKLLKNTIGWKENGNGTNASGFRALPGGFRYDSGKFENAGIKGYWWSSTDLLDYTAWVRSLFSTDNNVYSYFTSKKLGLSVRCIKD
jgi:endo-1,4-beta-xylanase